jgi:hypothetical protein
MILELEMITGERFQFFRVPRRIAIGLVQADEPAKYMKEFIERTYRFERARQVLHRIDGPDGDGQGNPIPLKHVVIDLRCSQHRRVLARTKGRLASFPHFDTVRKDEKPPIHSRISPARNRKLPPRKSG